MVNALLGEIRFYRRMLADVQTPIIAKWCLYLGLAYLASPIDLIPDFIPVLGHIDDLFIVGGLLLLARLFTPRFVQQRCRRPPDQSSTD